MKIGINKIPQDIMVKILKYYLKHNLKTIDNLKDDLQVISIIKRNTTKYIRNGSTNHKTTIISILTLVNLFGVENSMLLMKYLIKPASHSIIKTYMYHLKFIQENNFLFLINIDYDLLGELHDEDKNR